MAYLKHCIIVKYKDQSGASAYDVFSSLGTYAKAMHAGHSQKEKARITWKIRDHILKKGAYKGDGFKIYRVRFNPKDV